MGVRHWILAGLGAAVLSAAMVGCGGGGSSSSSTAIIPGDPAALAVDALKPVSRIEGIGAADIGTYGDGTRVALTELEIGFARSATVGAMNGLLESIGASVVYAQPRLAILLLRVPNPGSVDALDALVARLEADPLVRFVRRGYFPAPQALPSAHEAALSTVPEALNIIDHQLAVGAHGAWNVKAALDSATSVAPEVLVADWFGDGPPNADFALTSTLSDFGVGAPDWHGYHVLGVIGANFEGGVTPRGLVTGLYPEALKLLAVDYRRETLTWPATEGALIDKLQATAGNVVLNTSLGFECTTEASVARLCSETPAWISGIAWIEKVRELGLEGRVLHVSAAGNSVVEGDTNAAFASPFNAARLIPDLRLGEVAYPPLQNTVVVENVIAAGSPPQPICLYAGEKASKYPGDLSAVGTDVVSMSFNSDALPGTVTASGTSAAAPQVAALAAYVWALGPSRSNLEVIDILRRTARPVAPIPTDARCTLVQPAAAIDAYAAVLATDADLVSAKARRALLDVADAAGAPGGDGRFDEKDVALLLQKFSDLDGALDYSRYDLNGDGRIGGPTVARLDLDADGDLSTVTKSIEGRDVEYVEAQASDFDALCFYAYTGTIYQGDTDRRSELLREICRGSDIEVVIADAREWLDPSLGPRYVEYTVLASAYPEEVRDGEGDIPRFWLDSTCSVSEGTLLDAGGLVGFEAAARDPISGSTASTNYEVSKTGDTVDIQFASAATSVTSELGTGIGGAVAEIRYVQLIVNVSEPSVLTFAWTLTGRAYSDCRLDGADCASSYGTLDFRLPTVLRLIPSDTGCQRANVAYDVPTYYPSWTGGVASWVGDGEKTVDLSEQFGIPLGPGNYAIIFQMDVRSTAYGASLSGASARVDLGGALRAVLSRQ